MSESYREILGKLVETWRESVAVAREQAKAAREQVTATVVLAENVAALHESYRLRNPHPDDEA